MPPLSNARHERFCVALSEGHSIAESYALAGYSKNTGNASRLNGNERVRARVAELQAEAAVNSRSRCKVFAKNWTQLSGLPSKKVKRKQW
jgi:phage terminase small subunit